MKNLEDLQLEDISQIYYGKDNCCRCGCGGSYVATSFMKSPRSPVDDKEAEDRLRKAKAYNKRNFTAEYGGNYINVPMKNNKCYCIYVDELKGKEKK